MFEVNIRIFKVKESIFTRSIITCVALRVFFPLFMKICGSRTWGRGCPDPTDPPPPGFASCSQKKFKHQVEPTHKKKKMIIFTMWSMNQQPTHRVVSLVLRREGR